MGRAGAALGAAGAAGHLGAASSLPQHIAAASSPASPFPSSPQGQLSTAVISALRSPGLSLPRRPDADHACRASTNYSTAEQGRQWGRRQLLQ